MAEYNPNLPVDIGEKSRPATPSAPEFEPYLDIEEPEQETAQDSSTPEGPKSIFSLQCPLLMFLVLCLLAVALESVKIARAGGTRTQSVFATILLVLLMFVFFLLGLWLLFALCNTSQKEVNTATAIVLPVVFWLVASVATSSALGTTYRLFD